MRAVCVCLFTLLLACAQVWAVIETYEFSSPELEERYRALSTELRCPKCQNQNIADSNAPISRDLRQLLHRQLEAGASDEQIRDYMVARYGEFVRYRPRFGGVTAILWLAPLLLLGAAGGVAFLSLRSRRGRTDAAGLSEAEQQRLRDMLRERDQ
ncbi:MAG: cytochrome c-type biogenesis protein CcmH [Halioglobus sp.]|nr:cytochrome c-type biogenesis protein CcmH [Halioglobus sp.]